ncbi:MAG: hypothetical protein LBT59_25580 [Clostridiales bacterium]|nr:hypothetical protein [Clostridiales bacterium]
MAGKIDSIDIFLFVRLNLMIIKVIKPKTKLSAIEALGQSKTQSQPPAGFGFWGLRLCLSVGGIVIS